MARPSAKPLAEAVYQYAEPGKTARISQIVADVRAALDRGADINAISDDEGLTRTPLHEAVRGGVPEVVELLCERGADPNLGRGGWDATALHEAAERGDARIVRSLLLAGANRRAKDSHGRMPAEYAGRANIKQMLAPGAKLTKTLPPEPKRAPVPAKLVTFMRDRAKQYTGRTLTRVPGYQRTAALRVKFLRRPSDALFDENDVDAGAFPNYRPLAELVDEAQFLVANVAKPALPVLMWEHETGEFRPVAKSLDALLARLRARPASIETE